MWSEESVWHIANPPTGCGAKAADTDPFKTVDTTNRKLDTLLNESALVRTRLLAVHGLWHDCVGRPGAMAEAGSARLVSVAEAAEG